MIREGIRRAFRIVGGGRRAWERDVEEEIKLHLALRAEQLVANGATPDEALNEAVRRFGPLTESKARLLNAARHREQRMQRTEYLADLRQDLSFALRTLRRQKGWTTVAIVTLALGIGATTAVYSVVSSLLLHPLPYPDANRVVIVYQQPTGGNNTGISVTMTPSAEAIRAWKDGSHSFESLQPLAVGPVELRTTGEPLSLIAARIEAGFPRFAGERVLAGRMFGDVEVQSDNHVVLLGEGLWREKFGSNPGVIGKAITLDDSSYTIIGVLPATLQAPRVGAQPTDIWLPLTRNDRLDNQLVGRLRPGIDAAAAQRELDSLFARATSVSEGRGLLRTLVAKPAVAFRDSLVMLAYAVALVLLVACANVAHLLMVRMAGRGRELAVRAALGAGRGRVLRQLLTESLLLGMGGGGLGVFVGWTGLRAMVALRPPRLSALSVAHIDLTTLAIALGVTLATTIAFGVLGAIQSARHPTHESLKSGTNRPRWARRGRGSAALVVSEMALSATLVVGASMLVRSVINLQHADLGFEPKQLYTVMIDVPRGHLASGAAKGELLREVMTGLSRQAGVRSVAAAKAPPAWSFFLIGQLDIEGEPPPSVKATEYVAMNSVGSGFFRTLGVHLVAGSGFSDTTSAAHQVIINAGFAKKHWAGTSPIGRRIRVAQAGTEPWFTVVGVVNDASMSGPVLRDASAPLFYFAAADSDATAILVRTARSANPLASIRASVHSIDPRATPKVESVETVIAQSIAAPRFVMLLLTVFTVLALTLAAIGLYGVMAYSVAQQTREIGIRVALGATRSRIARRVVFGGVALAVFGSVVGLAMAAWGTKLIESQLYGIARSDAMSFIAAAVVLLGAALVACIVPTRRALGVDPMTAIRAD